MKFIIYSLLAFSSISHAQVCPQYDETKQIQIKLVKVGPGAFHADGDLYGYDDKGVRRASLHELNSRGYIGPAVDVYNSVNLYIGSTDLSNQNYSYYNLVFKQLSKDCPATLTIDRKSLAVVSISATCDPYK